MTKKISLKNYNSFNIDAQCDSIKPINSVQDLYSYLNRNRKFKILGGGSNILLSQDIDGDVLVNRIKGIEIIDENDEQVLVRVGGGEVWNQLVMWSVSHDLHGIENLVLIPGSVGAAPIQNIGAYGVEQSDTFHSLNALDLEEGINRIYYKNDCHFGYRESLFKNELKGRVFITHVTYLLNKTSDLNLSYGIIKDKLDEAQITHPSVKDVANVIAEIRMSKLPDPKALPNSGSFFKNPIVSVDHFKRLQNNYPNIKAYKINERYKISAAWLIENAGLKGYRIGDAAVYDNHSLILVNHGSASGTELRSLARHVQKTIKEDYSIQLEPEVNIW